MTRIRDTSIQFIKGVGPARKKLFGRLGVDTVEDLFYFFPRRYEDRTKMTALKDLKIGEYQTITGKVAAVAGRKSWYTKKHVYETAIEDGTGRVTAVWFNQPYLENYFKVGRQVVLYGKVDLYKTKMQIVSPEYEVFESDEDLSLNMGRIVPVYPLTKGMTQRYLRKVIQKALEKYLSDLEDVLPTWLRNKQQLINVRRSIANIHFPETMEQLAAAQQRVSFEEFFFFQLSVMLRRMSIVAKNGNAHAIDLDLLKQFSQSFPFSLTKAQDRVIRELTQDMTQETPMLRLLQGDVGSGKTVIALFGCIASARSGKQAGIMAPTEILARQHYETITSLLAGGPFKDIRAELLISGLPKKQKDRIYADIEKGDIQIVIGTHALLGEELRFAHLTFVVIDEQHKFGVKQRALLSGKGTNPDILVMTATPIPRTLSLTLFGDLDVSTLDEMPVGRGRMTTEAYSSEQAGDVYRRVREKVAEGEQAYIVYPIVEESEKLDLKAAEAMFAEFQKRQFKDIPVGLVHGKMKRKESDDMMAMFKCGKIRILVATTVLEVGVDVPNANVMVVEHAERFGLSQLHQLRGRIGRGEKDGLCLLITDPSTEEGAARIQAILGTTDGFKIAEQDLQIRGPGQYFGRHQHGLNELRFANPATQIDILVLARKEAEELVHADRSLSTPRNQGLRKVIQERYPTYLKDVEAG